MPNNWEEKFMSRIPKDDVWLRMYYPPQRHSLVDVIDMHRELACPEMFDNMEGYVNLNIELNMKTNKKVSLLMVL